MKILAILFKQTPWVIIAALSLSACAPSADNSQWRQVTYNISPSHSDGYGGPSDPVGP